MLAIFVWTLQDVGAAVVFGLIILVGVFVGLCVLWSWLVEKLKR